MRRLRFLEDDVADINPRYGYDDPLLDVERRIAGLERLREYFKRESEKEKKKDGEKKKQGLTSRETFIVMCFASPFVAWGMSNLYKAAYLGTVANIHEMFSK